jgi:hypothetical protein
MWRRAAAVVGVAAAVTAAIGCAQSEAPPEPRPIVALPESVLLAEAAPPFYSLQESSTGGQWIAVFADAVDFTLRLARGSLAAPQAVADEVITIDRVDLVPGINPYIGRHAYLHHDGIEHLFYTDQELADTRVTKWIYRPVDGAEPWTVDLLPAPVVPVAVLSSAAAEDQDQTDDDSAADGFTLLALRDDNGEQPVLAYAVRPTLLEDESAPLHTDGWALPAGAAPAFASGAPGPALSPFHCSGRHGLSLFDPAGLLIVERGRDPLRVDLPGHDAQLPAPASVACGSRELLVVAYARAAGTPAKNDDEATRRAYEGAHEIVAVAIDESGARSPERKITLAREVRALAVFPDRWPGDESVPPALTVLFSELAVDDSGQPEYRLSLVMPDAEGSYRKLILVRGEDPVQDARALRAEGKLAILFRRANQLRLLLVESVPPPAGGAAQSAGGW